MRRSLVGLLVAGIVGSSAAWAAERGLRGGGSLPVVGESLGPRSADPISQIAWCSPGDGKARPVLGTVSTASAAVTSGHTPAARVPVAAASRRHSASLGAPVGRESELVESLAEHGTRRDLGPQLPNTPLGASHATPHPEPADREPARAGSVVGRVALSPQPATGPGHSSPPVRRRGLDRRLHPSRSARKQVRLAQRSVPAPPGAGGGVAVAAPPAAGRRHHSARPTGERVTPAAAPPALAGPGRGSVTATSA